MATSTGKTIGLILLVAVILLLVWRMTPFILSPLGIFPSVFHLIQIPTVDSISCFPRGFFRMTSFTILSLTLLLIWIMVIVWVYRDAERRGMNGVLWALLVFIGNLIGLLIYLIVRSDNLPVLKSAQTTHPCPNCQKPVVSNFVFCPNCGTRLQAVCPKCEKPVENSWRVCPNCGEKLISEK